jgi:hypothetical protein
MNASYRSWPLFLGKALYDVWGHTEDTAETMEATLNHFARRWGGFDADAFQHALNGGDDDRLFALFALGYLAPAPKAEIIVPFLDSSLSKERWACIITLGRWKQEKILFPLLKLLQEGLVFTPPVDLSLAREDQSSRWEIEDARYQQEYEWYRIQRQQVALVLASWQHPLVLPALIQAFDVCYHQEVYSPAIKTHPYLGRDWQTFQDCLAYALGRQRAWDAPDRLALPPERLHIMRMFMVYGALHAKASRVLSGVWYLSYEEMGIKLEQVNKILCEHFHLLPEIGVAYYRDFMRYCTSRESSYVISGEISL